MRTDNLQQYIKLHRQLTEERGRIRERLRQIDEALGQLAPVSTAAVQGAATFRGSEPTALKPGQKGGMSPEGRARIAAAQRARWAAEKGETKPEALTAFGRPKRKMSAAGRRAIAEAARRRWAVQRALGKGTM